MIEFKGFDDWVPIFRGGKQKDSMGREHDGDALIDKAVAKFNAAVHEPPACIGHPADNKPAYGWVKGLKKGTDASGALLFAKFGQVQQDFGEMVKRGNFKKRSSAFYPDGSLRHVAFLGAAPPAVKGLPDMAFSDEPGAIFEFADYQTVWSWEAIARIFGKLRDYLIEKEGAEKADLIIDTYRLQEITDAAAKEKQELQQEAQVGTAQSILTYYEKEDDMTFKQKFIAAFNEIIGKMPDEGPAQAATAIAGQFSEADIQAAVAQATAKAAKEAREEVALEFAEKDKQARKAARKSEIDAWCGSMVKAGKLTPAMVKFGVPEFMTAFAEKDDVIEFGEAKDKATLYDRFKAFFEAEMPKMVTFKEVATRDKDTGGQGGAGEKLATLTGAKMKENKALNYSAAFAEVQRENPDLAREYAAEFREE